MSHFAGFIWYLIATLGGFPTAGPEPTAQQQEIIVATIMAVNDEGGNMRDVKTLLTIGWCESRLEPEAVNPSSGAAGIWQHMGNRTWGWPYRVNRLGFPPDTPPSDIWASARISAWLLLADEPGHGLDNWWHSYNGTTCKNVQQYDIPQWISEIDA